MRSTKFRHQITRHNVIVKQTKNMANIGQLATASGFPKMTCSCLIMCPIFCSDDTDSSLPYFSDHVTSLVVTNQMVSSAQRTTCSQSIQNVPPGSLTGIDRTNTHRQLLTMNHISSPTLTTPGKH